MQVDLDKLGRTQFMVQHQDGKFGHFAVEVRIPQGNPARTTHHSCSPYKYFYHVSGVRVQLHAR